MLNFTVKAGEYFMIGDDIRVVFRGGSDSGCKVMVEAPRSYNIVRGTVLEKNAVRAGRETELKKYYPEPALTPEDKRRLIAAQRRRQAGA